MKRTALLGATALAAVAFAASPADAQMRFAVTGFFNTGVYSSDVTGTSTSERTLGTVASGSATYTTAVTAAATEYEDLDVEIIDAELIFRGETSLDNGLTVGGRIEMEAGNHAVRTDESYFYLEGGFGEVIIGAHDPISVDLHQGNPWFTFNSVDYGFYAPLTGVATPAGSPGSYLTTRAAIGADAQGITYATPTFSGLKAGVTLAPEPGTTDARQGVAPAVKGGTRDALSLAVRYTTPQFGGLGVSFAQVSASAAAGKDPSQTSIGVSWGKEMALDFGYRTSETATAEDTIYSAAVGFKPPGQPYQLYAGFITGERESGGRVTGETTNINVTGVYNLGPGVNVGVVFETGTSSGTSVDTPVQDASGAQLYGTVSGDAVTSISTTQATDQVALQNTVSYADAEITKIGLLFNFSF